MKSYSSLQHFYLGNWIIETSREARQLIDPILLLRIHIVIYLFCLHSLSPTFAFGRFVHVHAHPIARRVQQGPPKPHLEPWQPPRGPREDKRSGPILPAVFSHCESLQQCEVTRQTSINSPGRRQVLSLASGRHSLLSRVHRLLLHVFSSRHVRLVSLAERSCFPPSRKVLGVLQYLLESADRRSLLPLQGQSELQKKTGQDGGGGRF